MHPFLQHLLDYNDRPDLTHEDREMLIEDLVLSLLSVFWNLQNEYLCVHLHVMDLHGQGCWYTCACMSMLFSRV